MINHIRYRVVKHLLRNDLEEITDPKSKKKNKESETKEKKWRVKKIFIIFSLSILSIVILVTVFGGVVFLRYRQLCSYNALIEQGWLEQTDTTDFCPNILDSKSWGTIIAKSFNLGISNSLKPAENSNFGDPNSETCDDPLSPICWVSGSAPELKSTDGFTNFLIVGVDGGRDGVNFGLQNTDTIMLASLEKATGKLIFISFPRDLYLNYQRPNGVNTAYKINAVYAIDGVEGLAGVIEQLTQRTIHYYGFIDLRIFEDIITTLGGVDIVLDEPFKDRFPCAEVPSDRECPNPVYFFDGQYGLFEFPAGPNNFDAFEAMVYARSRKTTSDFDRAARQQNLIKATLRQVLNDESPLNEKVSIYLDLYSLFKEKVETNIEIEDVAAVFALAEKLDSAAVSLVVDNNIGGPGALIKTLGILPDVGWSIGFIDTTHKQFQNYVDSIWNNLAYYIDKPKVLFVNSSGKALTEKELAPIVENNNFVTYRIDKSSETSALTKLYDFTDGEKVGTLYDIQSKLPGSLVFDSDIDGIIQSDYQEDILVIVGE